MTDTAGYSGSIHNNIIDAIITKPPSGYVYVVMATQASHYDLFMLTIIRRAIELELRTLEIITEARNRSLMADIASLQNEEFQILEISYGQDILGMHTCSPHLHEINIMMRELRNVINPRIISFEALTPLLIDFSPRDVVQFFKESVEESIKTGSIEFFLIHSETADPVTINQIFSLAQGIITLSTSRGKYYLSIKKSTGVELPFNPIEYVPNMTSPNRKDWQIDLNW